MNRKIIALLAVIAIGFCPTVYGAATAGEVSAVMTSLVAAFTGILEKICFVIGAGLLIGAVIRYKEHRDNPTQVRIGDSVALLIAGTSIAVLPLLARLSEAYTDMAGL